MSMPNSDRRGDDFGPAIVAIVITAVASWAALIIGILGACGVIK